MSDPGLLLVAALFLPVVSMMLMLLIGGRAVRPLAVVSALLGVGIATAIVVDVVRRDAAIVYVLGGWEAPLGITLRADGMSAAMLLSTALIMLAATIVAWSEFAAPPGLREARASISFWVLLQGVWAALAAVFTSSDLFNFYVALELLTFAAVPLVSLEGRASTLLAALRYLLFALLGSLAYLLGVAIVYGAFGALDLRLLAERIGAAPSIPPAVAIALALMTAGLLAKTALFPLHLWLPPAHGGAPPAASAILSSLVVKGSFFIVLRIWFDLMPAVPTWRAAPLLGALGALAIVHGSVMALRQDRLKMLIAYSTVAQLGYLFLVFPLADIAGAPTAESRRLSDGALTGGMLQAVSHAFAKSSMFLGAGVLAAVCGSDRLDALRGAARAAPITVLAIAIAGLSLIGLPPSGGFWAKWILLTVSVETGQWWWAMVILAGGLLAVGYVYRVLRAALDREADPQPIPARSRPAPLAAELAILALALVSLLLGLFALTSFDLMTVGRTATPEVAAP